MKRIAILTSAGVAMLVLLLCWRHFDKAPDDFKTVEENLNGALQRLREAPVADRRTDASLVSSVMVLADALAQSSDTRQKRLAAAVKKESGQILFGNGRSAKATSDGSVSAPNLGPNIEPFPGPLPEQQFIPLPLDYYVGTYSGDIAGRQVIFVVTVTERNLLGIRIVGLDVQPALEFAEIHPQEFIRPDARALVLFTDRTNEVFRTLVFQQNGVRERAENTLFSASGSK